DQDIRWIGRRARPTGRSHFTHPIGTSCQVGEAVIAVAVRQCAGLAKVQRTVVIGIEEDGPARQAGFAAILAAIAVDIIERLTAERIRLEVAEVDPTDTAATAGSDIGGIERGAHPAGWGHFAYAVRPRPEVGESVVAVAIGEGARPTSSERAALVAVQEDRATEQARLTDILASIALRIV